MKERGIILTADEVRGLRDGSLRELRRPVHHRRSWYVGADDDDGDPWPFLEAPARYLEPAPIMMACPFGQPGDWLWVKETWHPCARLGLFVMVEYRATKDEMEREWDGHGDIDSLIVGWWRSPATMPRWASRWTLEIESVSVEWNATAERWDWLIGVKQVVP